jgi:hypothetical protein
MRVTNLLISQKISLIFMAILCTTLRGTTIYVDDDGPSDFNNIQVGIDVDLKARLSQFAQKQGRKLQRYGCLIRQVIQIERV